MNNDLSIISQRTIGIILIVGIVAIFLGYITLVIPFTTMIGLIIFFFLIALFLHRPLWGFLIIVMLRLSVDFLSSRFSFTFTENIHFNVAALFAILLIITSGILFVMHWHAIRHTPLFIPFTLLIIFAAISYFYSIDTIATLQETLRITSILMSFCGAYILTTLIPYARKTTVGAIVIASIIPLFFAIIQLMTHAGFTDTTGTEGRLFGTFKHPNAFAAFLLVIIAILTYRAFSQKITKQERTFAIILLFLTITLLLFTFSRGGWFALILFFAIFSAMKAPKLLFAVGGITIVLFFTSHIVHDRIEEIYNPPADSSIRWRIHQWKNAIAAWQLSPVYGYGAGTEIAIHEQEQGFYAGNPYTHNDFIKALQETGIIGFALFLFLIIMTITLLIKKYRHTTNYDAKLFVLIVTLLFIAEIGFGMSSNIWRSTAIQWIIWILVACALTIPVAHKNTFITKK